MKKVLPLLLVIMLAFTGCQSGPATYETAENPQEIVAHAEKFVSQVSKKAKHYNAEDWDAAISQFVQMGKNYSEYKPYFSEQLQMQYDNARMEFIRAVDANGSEELALRVKKEYGAIFE
ncbi:MAG: hypothetical protein IKX35_02490 [Bacteroidales bacterium]|nr:hypothetical protein [Bacteroidales bacterium]